MDADNEGMLRYVLAIDVGGTFTDIVRRASDGSVRLANLPTSHGNPSQAVLVALEMARDAWGVRPEAITRFTHGSHQCRAGTQGRLRRLDHHPGL